MIVLPVAALMAPPALVMKEIVTELELRDATRCKPAIAKVGPRTLSPMGPESTRVGLLLASLEVRIETLVAPAVAAPIVRPLIVIVTAALPAITEDAERLSTIKLLVGVAELAVTPPLQDAVGVPEFAKKPAG